MTFYIQHSVTWIWVQQYFSYLLICCDQVTHFFFLIRICQHALKCIMPYLYTPYLSVMHFCIYILSRYIKVMVYKVKKSFHVLYHQESWDTWALITMVFITKVCVSTVLILRHQPSWMWTLNIYFAHIITWKPGVLNPFERRSGVFGVIFILVLKYLRLLLFIVWWQNMNT